jgi:hypothetical protein
VGEWIAADQRDVLEFVRNRVGRERARGFWCFRSERSEKYVARPNRDLSFGKIGVVRDGPHLQSKREAVKEVLIDNIGKRGPPLFLDPLRCCSGGRSLERAGNSTVLFWRSSMFPAIVRGATTSLLFADQRPPGPHRSTQHRFGWLLEAPLRGIAASCDHFL